MTFSKAHLVDRADALALRALLCLEGAMGFEPGAYPDPGTPIAKWQLAHQHLLAARELLKEGTGT